MRNEWQILSKTMTGIYREKNKFRCLKIDQAGKVCGQIRKTHASMLGHFVIDHGQAAEVTTDRATKKKEYTFRPCREDEIPLAWCRNRDVGMGEWHKRWDA